MRIVREHWCPDTTTDTMPFSNVQWAMDDWFTSKPLDDELLCLEQYPYDTMERKIYVAPFVTHRNTKKNKNSSKGYMFSSAFT
eukprot:784454-Ditylum_brightwellii.AAC.1